MKKIRYILSFLIVSLILFSFQSFTQGQEDERIGEEIKLIVGQAKIFPVNNPTRIVIGNPDMLDVTYATKSEITLSPKSAGSTTLVIWDSLGEHSYRAAVASKNMQPIKDSIDNILKELNLPEVYTKIEDAESKIFILGRVKEAKDIERIGGALDLFKDEIIVLTEVKEERAVVEIDVQVLELTEDATKTLGFNMPGSISMSEPTYRISKTARGALDAVFHVFDWPRDKFTATIDALVQEGKANILSRPRLACQSGKKAELMVGGEKPTFSTSLTTGTEGTAVEYKEYGIKLNISPEVTQDRKIKLSLDMEVSETGEAEFIGSEENKTAAAYPLTKRNASTELFLEDSQTLVIGGLIKKKKEEDRRKVAGLGDLPLIGLFFRHKTTRSGGGFGESGDVELIITLTPTIVSEEKPAIQAKDDESFDLDYSVSINDELSDPLANYAHIIQKRILENLTYPQTAKQNGFQGTVKLSLLLSYRGEVLDVVVKNSSGYQVLDDSAILLVKQNSPYPPFPSSVAMKDLWIDIPIVFQLE
ncbi:MAG: TonB family protein [Candidatus Omnitrophota bacterium]